MAISYHIYGNDGMGGDVDYGSPIATTSGLTFVPGPLATPGDHRFAVRAFDASSGIEEANTDARVRIILDSAGNDVTARPNAVVGLSARATAGATCWVGWGYDPKGQGGPPSAFQVSLTPGSSALATAPASMVAYRPGVVGYGCSLAGLPADTPCTIAVRAVGPSSMLLGPVATVSILDNASPLSDVDGLTATPTA